MATPLRRTVSGRFFFGDHDQAYSFPDPEHESLSEAMYRMRYAPEHVTASDRHTVLAAAEAYCHLAAHPANTADVVAQLRDVRREVRRRRGR